MTIIKWGELAPDQATRDTPALVRAENVVPGPGYYGPWPAWVATATATLPSQCLSAFLSIDPNGDPLLFAGTATKLYRYDRVPSVTWTDVSKTATTYSASADERWTWAQFGDTLIAVNVNNKPQAYDLTSAGTFDDLAGSPPQARVVSVVGDFVFLANEAGQPNKVTWSGLNDPTTWTAGTNFSDSQVFPDGGAVTAVVDGDVPVILQQNGTRRLQFVPGSPEIFQITKIDRGRGCQSIFGSCRTNNFTWYMTEDGMYRTNGIGVEPIGMNKVSRKLLADINDPTRVQMVADATNPRVYIAFPSSQTSEFFDRVAVYDWTLDRWSIIVANGDFLMSAQSFGYTLEQLDAFGDLDSLPASLDSRIWRGGAAVVAAVRSGQWGTFAGTNYGEAIFETGDIEPTPGRLTFVSGLRPIVDTSAALCRVGGKLTQHATATLSTETGVNRAGICDQRAEARYFFVRVRIPAGTAWTRAEGVQPYFQPGSGQ